MLSSGSVSDVKEKIQAWRKHKHQIIFVPTMGNLHDGHLALVKAACRSNSKIIVSIFVNPLQFGKNEDFDDYPRTLEEDSSKLAQVDTDLLFIPNKEIIYPKQGKIEPVVLSSEMANILEGESRPGFFNGVATAVKRLFDIVQPDIAIFGEKDFQQLLIIKQLVKDEQLPVKIEAVATEREKDGLAMSSRNNYLSKDERNTAVKLQQILRELATAVQSGTDRDEAERQAIQQLESSGFDVEYVSVRTQATLSVPLNTDNSLIVLVAAKIGRTRLIDNVLFELKQNKG